MLEQCLLITVIVDNEALFIIEFVYITPKNTHTAGMKCQHPHVGSHTADKRCHTLPHFAGRLVREGQCKDTPRLHHFFLNQVCNSISEHAGLAAACPREDKERSFRTGNCTELLFIQFC